MDNPKGRQPSSSVHFLHTRFPVLFGFTLIICSLILWPEKQKGSSGQGLPVFTDCPNVSFSYDRGSNRAILYINAHAGNRNPQGLLYWSRYEPPKDYPPPESARLMGGLNFPTSTLFPIPESMQSGYLFLYDPILVRITQVREIRDLTG